ncbi:MAG: S41 family peptidase [Rikenellaceae bacterium]
MNKIYLRILILASLVSIVGCRNQAISTENLADKEISTSSATYWSEFFDAYWEAMNQSYVFWKYDNTDWDKIKTNYAPIFSDLDSWRMESNSDYYQRSALLSHNQDSLLFKGDSTALMYLNSITTGLLDHHYSLAIKDLGCFLDGGGDEVSSRDYYSDRSGFTEGLLTSYYDGLDDGSITDEAYGEYESEDGDIMLISYCLNGDIAYLYVSKYGISDAESDPIDPDDDTLEDVLDNFEDIVRGTPDLKGVILDVRCNTGGTNDDLDEVFGRFIADGEILEFGYSQHKAGPGRLDYTQVTPVSLKGSSDEATLDFPIVVLADIGSVSLAEITCVVARAFSAQSIVVGERTFGGTCSLMSDIYLAGGVIENDNMRIYTSSGLFYDLDMNFYEGVGITPDIEVFYDPTWVDTGIDSQKQAAVDYLNGL